MADDNDPTDSGFCLPSSSKRPRIDLEDGENQTYAGVYAQQTKYRTRKVKVGEEIFYVNPHFLGELSSFFDNLFNNDSFSDSTAEIVNLKEETAIRFRLFLDVVGANMETQELAITHRNVYDVMTMADRYDAARLLQKCASHLEIGHINVKKFDLREVIDLLQLILQIDIAKTCMVPLLYYLGVEDHSTLIENEVQEIKPSSVAIAIFSLQRFQQHKWRISETGYCDNCRPFEEQDAWVYRCLRCRSLACRRHKHYHCEEGNPRKINFDLLKKDFPVFVNGYHHPSRSYMRELLDDPRWRRRRSPSCERISRSRETTQRLSVDSENTW